MSEDGRIAVLELQVKRSIEMLAETRGLLEQLAAKQGLEYSQDLKKFVLKEALDNFREAAK